MSPSLAEKIADALLFEGYMLYPYRPSSVKNRQRFNFGVIYPAAINAQMPEGADSAFMRTECLAEGNHATAVTVTLRFLHLVQRVDDRAPLRWQEAMDRAMQAPTASLGSLAANAQRVPFSFNGTDTVETVRDEGGAAAGTIHRQQRAVHGELELSAQELEPGLFRIRVDIRNVSPVGPDVGHDREELLLHSLVSAHTILTIADGAFISLLDPPDAHREHAGNCASVRCWPVLVGEAGQRNAMLSSPIIVYDYPLIAPESAGDLFDGTEIDEILSLRILTMTDAEQREMRESDPRARRLLDRTLSLDAEQFMRMHGAMREVGSMDGERT